MFVPTIEPRDQINAVGCSGSYNGYPLDRIYEDGGGYWCSTDNCSSIWMTFDCHNHQMSKIFLAFNGSYKAGKVYVYTKSSRGGGWKTWNKIAEGHISGTSMTIDINWKHEKFVCLRFFDKSNGYVGLQRFKFELTKANREIFVAPVVPPEDEIKAVGSSGTYNGYPLDAMYDDDDRYWCSTDNCGDIWMTFDADWYQISKIFIKYHPSYVAKKVFIYSKNARGGGWNTWKHVGEGDVNNNMMDVHLESNHEKFVCFRFFNWTNGYVGIQRMKFEVREPEPRINAVACSGTFNGYPLEVMYHDDDRYWCSTTNCNDVWMTFDCESYLVSKISVEYHPSYHSKKVFVYTNATRPFGWNQGTFIKEVGMVNNAVNITLASHDKFVCLRFFNWINGYVGKCLLHISLSLRFELSDDV